jgi:hypothetical protein
MRPRTPAQIIAAAMRTNGGVQKPSGFLAEHSDRHHAEYREWRDAHPWNPNKTHEENMEGRPASDCPECQQWHDVVTHAWGKGEDTAQAHVQALKQEQLFHATMLVHQAYCDVAPVEPAISYISGYHSVIDDARRSNQP